MTTPEGGDERGLVDGEGDSLPHTRIAKSWVLYVEVEIVDACAGAGGDAKIRLVAERMYHVHRQNVALNISRAFFHLERRCDCVGDHLKSDALNGGARRTRPVAGVAVENHLLALHLANKAEGSRADRMQAFISSRAPFDDAKETIAEVEEQAGQRRPGMDDDSESIGRIDSGDARESPSLGGDECAVGHAADGPRNVVGRKRVPIVEVNAGTNVKDPGEGIGELPATGEPRLEAEARVLADKGIIDKFANALRLRVGALANVEVVRRALNKEGKSMRLRRGPASGKQGTRCQKCCGGGAARHALHASVTLPRTTA